MPTRFRIFPLALVALAVSAQAGVAQRPNTAECRLNFRSNFRLNGAQQHLAAADNANHPVDKQRRAGDALRVLLEASAQSGVDPTALWLFMGRAYALRGDLVGADSAWRRASLTADDACKDEINRRRRNEYIPFNNAAVGHLEADRNDSALAVFRRGVVIYPEASAFITMGNIFMQMQQEDSAVAYWRRASAFGGEARTLDSRLTALFNAARVLHRAEKYAQADTVYREYLRQRPNDSEARSGLATVLIAQNRRAEAIAMYDSMMSNADSLSSFDLFDTGVALFRMAQADTARADSVRRQDLFGKAARAFELGLVKNPHLRDALYNLTNTYIAMNDTAKALASAKRLVAADPMNAQAMRLLAASYQRYMSAYNDQMRRATTARDTAAVRRLRPLVTAYQDSTVSALSRSDSLPFDVQVNRFQQRDSTVQLRGAVVNRTNGERPGFNLTFEFLNAAGEVVASETVQVPTLAALGQTGGMYDFTLNVNGRGIIAYRYRSGS